MCNMSCFDPRLWLQDKIFDFTSMASKTMIFLQWKDCSHETMISSVVRQIVAWSEIIWKVLIRLFLSERGQPNVPDANDFYFVCSDNLTDCSTVCLKIKVWGEKSYLVSTFLIILLTVSSNHFFSSGNSTQNLPYDKGHLDNNWQSDWVPFPWFLTEFCVLSSCIHDVSSTVKLAIFVRLSLKVHLFQNLKSLAYKYV